MTAVPPLYAAACALVALSLAAGQVLFKLAARDIAAGWPTERLAALVSPWLAVALIVYAGATALWVFVLMHVPLSRAYPFVLLAVPLVPLAGYLFFDEAITLRYLAGLAMVLAGLAMIQAS